MLRQWLKLHEFAKNQSLIQILTLQFRTCNRGG
jgi:hypothetical protein